MSTTTVDTDMLASSTEAHATASSLAGIGRTLRTVIAAVREGIVAGQHYEVLRAQGLGSQEALNRALAETGANS